MSMIDHDDIDRMRDAARSLSADSSLPVLVRRSDGKRFRVVLQARSPNGPAELLACDGPPFERVNTTNDRLLVDFNDPRKAASQPDRCGGGNVCEWMRAAVATNEPRGVSFVRREMEHPDTLAPVTRVVASVQGARTIVVRACPACGGSPNEAAPVMR